MNKNTTNVLLLVLVVFGAVWFLGGTHPAQPSTTSGGVTTGGVTVNAFTPTLDFTVADFAVPNTILNGQKAQLTVGGNTKVAVQGTATNANNGDAYSIQLYPTSTYYAPNAVTGTVNGTTIVPLKMKLISTSTSDWANNDASNQTVRNSTSAPDTVGSGGAVSPEFCLKNTITNSFFGKDKYGFLFDYNSGTWETPTFSGAVVDSLVSISGHGRATGTDTTIGVRVDGELGANETKCVGFTIKAKSGVNPGTYANDGNITILWVDNFKYIDSVTGSIVEGYATNTGADTNSATNNETVYYVS